MAMGISGFGELESYRRAMRKDDARVANARKAAQGAATNGGEETAPAAEGDAVRISPEARIRSKLAALPEIRPGVVEAAREKLERGELQDPATVERGVRKLLTDMLNDGV